MKRDNKFLKKEFQKALFPVMISVLGGTVNALIDSAFVTRRLDSDALAAVGLTMPIFLVLCTVGCLFAQGGSVAASRSLGKNDKETAGQYYNTSVLMMVIASVVFMVAGLFGSHFIASLLCNDPILLPMVEEYGRITLMGSAAFILICIPSYYLQLDGKGKYLSIMMGVVILTDIIFDYLFLFVFDLGVRGASLASVISVLLATIYGFTRLQTGKGIFKVNLSLFKIANLKEIVMFGSTSAIGNLFDVIRLAVLNWILYIAGGAGALAVWTVLNSLLELSLCITTGVPRTASPLLGIYLGGYDNEGARMIVDTEIKLGLALSVIYAGILAVFHHQIGEFFKLDSGLLFPMICLGISVIFELIATVLSSYFNVAKRIMLSDFIMFLETLFFPLLFAAIFLVCGVPIWLFLPFGMGAVVLVTLLVVWAIARRSRGETHELSSVLLLDRYTETTNRVKGFSVLSSDEAICKASEDITEFCIENNMDVKTAKRIGLAMEEVMTVMARKSLKNENDPVDVRVFSLDGVFGISIMCSGTRYDLFQEAEDSDDDFHMGVQMINKMAEACIYIYTLGMNVLSVVF
ncbi:MAG: hypothetical protein IK152_02680 [Lachnospiraceae bacterium]|nr:hypothetical protein [Lachnospiraceae bacterium]